MEHASDQDPWNVWPYLSRSFKHVYWLSGPVNQGTQFKFDSWADIFFCIFLRIYHVTDIFVCFFADISCGGHFFLRFVADIFCGGHFFLCFFADISCGGHFFLCFCGHILWRTYLFLFFCGHIFWRTFLHLADTITGPNTAGMGIATRCCPLQRKARCFWWM